MEGLEGEVAQSKLPVDVCDRGRPARRRDRAPLKNLRKQKKISIRGIEARGYPYGYGFESDCSCVEISRCASSVRISRTRRSSLRKNTYQVFFHCSPVIRSKRKDRAISSVFSFGLWRGSKGKRHRANFRWTFATAEDRARRRDRVQLKNLRKQKKISKRDIEARGYPYGYGFESDCLCSKYIYDVSRHRFIISLLRSLICAKCCFLSFLTDFNAMKTHKI